jgi:DNA-binding NarL/FixJ family response regulator
MYQDPADLEYQLIEQHARMLLSDDPALRESGGKYLREVAKLAAQARILKRIDTKRGGSGSALTRRSKNAPRDRRIHDARSRGASQKQIALDEKVSESVVSRVLKNPRP